MRKFFFAPVAAALLLNFGCAAGNEFNDCAAEACDAAVPLAREAKVALGADAPAALRRSAPAASGVNKNNFQTPEGHQMAFTAYLKLNVSDVRASVSQARELVQKLGGYVKRMDDNSAVLAVPVAKADDALAELAAFGVLTSLRIEGEDVTQQVTDLAVRLDNLEKSRKRLLALLEKAEKVEEMIKVEEALTRVTTELERLQAQQKNLQGRIDYVTMNVTFSATVSKTPVRRDATPVAWINRLGENLLAVNRTISYSEEEFIFDLELPAGFVKNGSEGALSGDNCVIELCSRNAAITATHWYGNDYASLDFYRPLIEKALAERFGVPVETDLRSIGGTDGAVFTVRPEIGKTAYFYRIAVAVIRGEVKGIAAFGERENIERSLPESAWNGLLDSVRF